MHSLIVGFVLFQTHRISIGGFYFSFFFNFLCPLVLGNHSHFQGGFIINIINIINSRNGLFSFLLKMSRLVTSRFICLATCMCYLQSVFSHFSGATLQPQVTLHNQMVVCLGSRAAYYKDRTAAFVVLFRIFQGNCDV